MFVALCESAVHVGKKFVFKSSQKITEEDVEDYVREEIPEEYYYGDGEEDYDYDEPSFDSGRFFDDDDEEDEDWDDVDEECCYLDINEIKEVSDDDPILKDAIDLDEFKKSYDTEDDW